MTIDILTFGETMLRFSPLEMERLSQARVLQTWVAGSESNLAVAARVLGVSTSWVGRLPDNALGRRIVAELNALGVETSAVVWADPGERVGTFYYEPAAPPRVPHTIYDRACSAASRFCLDDLPDTLFQTHRHLHVTGITAALSESCAAAVNDAVRRARQSDMTVSLDVNFRAKLWSSEAAGAALSELAPQVDILICARWDAARLFGITGADTLTCALALQRLFKTEQVVITDGSKGAAGCDSAGTHAIVAAFPAESTIGRLGSGDAFAAGYLTGYLLTEPLADCLRLGAAMAALKRRIPGDMLVATKEEVEIILSYEEAAEWR